MSYYKSSRLVHLHNPVRSDLFMSPISQTMKLWHREFECDEKTTFIFLEKQNNFVYLSCCLDILQYHNPAYTQSLNI